GEIVRFDRDQHRRLPIDGGHLSYPCTFEFDGRQYVLPEMESWSQPLIYELTATGAKQHGELQIEGAPRLIDATMHQHDGSWYVFANRSDEGSGVLRLWTAQSPFAQFVEHPESPIRIAPGGARMGGAILSLADGMYRPGQDF